MLFLELAGVQYVGGVRRMIADMLRDKTATCCVTKLRHAV